MAYGNIEKMEKDYTKEVDELLENKIEATLESLTSFEKKTRNAGDSISTGRILEQIVKVHHHAGDWKGLNESITTLSKKHGQLKQANTKLVQCAMTYLDNTPDMETKLALIATLRTVTEGKIFVEVERANLTRMLAKIKEEEGNLVEASNILQELQVETFGSMEKRDKTDFILEQMRLCLLTEDYIRTVIISKKINTSFFKNSENDDLKLRFYKLMIEYSLHEGEYLNICKYYREIYNTKSLDSDEEAKADALSRSLLFCILSPYDHEQSDLLHRILTDKQCEEIASLATELAKIFTADELMRWPVIEETYGPTLVKLEVFKTGTMDGLKRWEDFHARVIEHNIRIISKYYTRVTLERLTQLLDQTIEETEEFLSNLVVKKTIYARIDRPAGIVSFVKPRNTVEVLGDWTSDVNSLLNLIEQTTHLISKEEMVHKISQTM
ncbi:hypothetical protein K502DRAFT_343605 [Neoconidiobolus thromboides FSU 785]|nr:hypothetical protein K502DRAFT_343605 [Neoconidiobolus thromboides FSU 785]